MGQRRDRDRRITPARLLRICLFVILLGLIPVLYLNLSISVLDDLAGRQWGGADFTAYYTAARLIRDGKSPYDATAFAQEAESLGFREDRPYIYLPLLAIVITPLALLSPQPAALMWFWMNVALLILSTMLIIRMLGLHKNRIYVVVMLIGALTFYPAVFSIFVGQANTLILALVVLTFYLSKRGRERLAGITLALASLIKIFPFCITLYFLWKGRYRVFLYTLAALILLTGFSVVVVGLDAHWTYVDSVLPTQFLKSHPLNQSLSGFIARTVPIDQHNGLVLWRLLTLSASALLALVTILIIPPGRKNEEAFDLETSLVIVAMLLISTVSWIGTLTLLIIPYAVITKHLVNGFCREKCWLLLLAMLSFLLVNSQRLLESYIILSSTGSLISPWLLSLPMYGLITLWLSIACTLLRRRKAPAVSDMPS